MENLIDRIGDENYQIKVFINPNEAKETEPNKTKEKLLRELLDKIKTFDDVLEAANLTLNEVIPWKNAKTKRQKFQNAVAKIQLIAEVLNEGWKAKFGIGQNNYYPWFEKKASIGWVYYTYRYGSDVSGAGGVVAYFKNAELAKYAGTQFIAQYEQLLDNY